MIDLSSLSDNVGWVVAIVGGLVTLAVLARKGWRKARRAITKGGQVIDTLVGREAVVHPETGKELIPATVGIGARMVRLEDAFLTLVNQGDRISALEHTQIKHDDAIEELKAASMERVITRAESTQAWQTIESAINAQPPDHDQQ